MFPRYRSKAIRPHTLHEFVSNTRSRLMLQFKGQSEARESHSTGAAKVWETPQVYNHTIRDCDCILTTCAKYPIRVTTPRITKSF